MEALPENPSIPNQRRTSSSNRTAEHGLPQTQRNSIMFPSATHTIRPNPPIRTSSLPAMFDQRAPNTSPFIRPSPSGRGQTLTSKKEAHHSKMKGGRKNKQNSRGARSVGNRDEEWSDEPINDQASNSPTSDEDRQVALTQLVSMLLNQPVDHNRYSQIPPSWKLKYGLSKNGLEPSNQRNFTSPATLNTSTKSKMVRSTSQRSKISITRKSRKRTGRFRSFVRVFSCASGDGIKGGFETPSESGNVNNGRDSKMTASKGLNKRSAGKKSPRKQKLPAKDVEMKKTVVESHAWVDISLNSGRDHSVMGISLSSHTVEEMEAVNAKIPIIQRISPSPTPSLDSSRIFSEVEESNPSSSNSGPVNVIHPCDRETISTQVPRHNSEVIHSSHLREVQNIDSFTTSSDESLSVIEGRLEDKDEVQPVLSSTPPRNQANSNGTDENRRVFSNHSLPSTLPDTVEYQSNDGMILSPSQIDEGEFIEKLKNGRKVSGNSSNSSNSMNHYLKYGPSIGLNPQKPKEIRRLSPREELLKQKQKQLNQRAFGNSSKSRNSIEGGNGDDDEQEVLEESYDTLDHLPEWIENYCSTPPKFNASQISSTHVNHVSTSYTHLASQQSNHPIRSSTLGSKKEHKSFSNSIINQQEENLEAETSISFSAWVDLDRYQQSGIAGSRSASGGHLRSISGKRIIDRDVFVEGLEAKSGLDRLCEALDEAEIQIEKDATQNRDDVDEDDDIAIQSAYLAPLISTSSFIQNQSKEPTDDQTFSENNSIQNGTGLEGLSHSESAQAITRLLGLGGIVTLDSSEFVLESESRKDGLVSESNSFDSENIFYASEGNRGESDGSIFEQRSRSQGENQEENDDSLEKKRFMNQLIKENSHLEENLENESLKGKICHVGSGELKLEDFPDQRDELKGIESSRKIDTEEGAGAPLPEAFPPPTSPASFDHHLAGTPCTWFLSTIDEHEEEDIDVESEQVEGEDESMNDTFALKESVDFKRQSSMLSTQSIDPNDSSIGLVTERGHTIWKEDFDRGATSSPILTKVLQVTQSPSAASNLDSELTFSSSTNGIQEEATKEDSISINDLEGCQRYELDEESEEERCFKQGIYQQSLVSQVKVKTKKRGQTSPNSTSASSHSNQLLSPSAELSSFGLSPILESPNPDSTSCARFQGPTYHHKICLKEPCYENRENQSSRKKKEKPTALWGNPSSKGEYPKFSFSEATREDAQDKRESQPTSPVSPTSLLPLPVDASSGPIHENKRGSWSSGVSYESEIDSRRASTASASSGNGSSQGGYSVATSITSASYSSRIPCNLKGKAKEILLEDEKGDDRIERGQISDVIKKSESFSSFRSSLSNESEVSHGGLIDTFPSAPETSHSSSSDKALADATPDLTSRMTSSSQDSMTHQEKLLKELKVQLETKKPHSKTVHTKTISTSNQSPMARTITSLNSSSSNPMNTSDSQEIDQMLSPAGSASGISSESSASAAFRHKISPGIAARFQAAYTYTRPVGPISSMPQSSSSKAAIESLVDLKDS